MRVEVVAVGTELLLGQIVDTNSSWIGEQLAMAGLDSHYQTKVGDNPDRIKAVIAQALERSDAVITCGGLGPTQDDLTRDVIADLLGVKLVLDDTIADRIGQMFATRGREMPQNNLRQAMVPVGCSTIPQQPGTAPGLICPVGDPATGKVIYAVPGVPYEMKEMVAGTILGDLISRSGEPAVIRSRVLRTWGTSESALAEILADRIDELDHIGNPTLAFLASGVEGLKVRITAKAADEAGTAKIIAAEEKVLEPLIGHLVFAYDDDNMESVVVDLLRSQGLTLAVAESLTGGYIAGRLSSVAGSDDVFVGGVVSGRSTVAERLLGVPDGASVSEETAVAMADGIREAMAADIGVATIGVDGSEAAAGSEAGLAPGTSCLAVSVAGSGAVATTVRLPGDRERIRQFSAITLLDLLRRVLLDG